jgi:hypothetical protein
MFVDLERGIQICKELTDDLNKLAQKSNECLEFIVDGCSIYLSNYYPEPCSTEPDYYSLHLRISNHTDFEKELQLNTEYVRPLHEIVNYFSVHAGIKLVESDVTKRHDIDVNAMNEILKYPTEDEYVENITLSALGEKLNFNNYSYIMQIKGNCDDIDWDIVRIAAGLDYKLRQHTVILDSKDGMIKMIVNKGRSGECYVSFHGPNAFYLEKKVADRHGHSILLYDAASIIKEDDFYISKSHNEMEAMSC